MVAEVLAPPRPSFEHNQRGLFRVDNESRNMRFRTNSNCAPLDEIGRTVRQVICRCRTLAHQIARVVGQTTSQLCLKYSGPTAPRSAHGIDLEMVQNDGV